MFGYVTICKPELKIREYERYRQYYCGLCEALKKQHSWLGQMTLTYDMTFLVMLLTSLYEPETDYSHCRCVVHPAKKHGILLNDITRYAADMNIVLAYYKYADDWMDEHSIMAMGGFHIFQGKYLKIREHYPKQCEAIGKYLRQLQKLEKAESADIDKVAGCFGRLMGILFQYREDCWSRRLKKMGFYLGKFIYIMDAYMDLQEDKKKHCYNPLVQMEQDCTSREEFEDKSRELLTIMIAESCKEFEKLPLLQDAEILRNILYAGVWQKFDRYNREQENAKGRVQDEKGPISGAWGIKKCDR